MTSFRWNTISNHICLALNSLLLFLAIFSAKMQAPEFLQTVGRLHPLLLHFPIVLLLLGCIWELCKVSQIHPVLRNAGDAFLSIAALSAGITALLGLFLSKEGGYAPETLRWHQWSGVAVSLLAWGWFAFRSEIRSSVKLVWLGSGLSLITLLIAGHQGATLTHGENYLWPTPPPPAVPLENALVFEHLVRPILKEKCMNCHNSLKAKGELNMETEATLLKGGKNGPLWDSTDVSFGLLMHRVQLGPEEKEHMPPKGKPQLTENEITILSQWIKSGASFSQKIADLPENDPLRMLFAPAHPVSYPFAAADEKIIEKLNNDYRLVAPLALHSPALNVEFYGVSAFKSSFLTELEPVKVQIVQLNLNRMPVKDTDMKMVASFQNLEKLNLAFTSISGFGLNELKGLKELRTLSLSGTSIKAGDLGVLKDLSALRELFVWNTPLSEPEIKALQQQFPGIHISSGFRGENVLAKLNAPIIEEAAQVFSHSTKVKLKNFIQGAVIRYTLDGSVPDSLAALLYTGDSITIDHSCQLKAKAFLPGWISSEVSTRSFYKNGVLPDSIVLLFPPNPQYKGEGPQTLANQKIGDTDFRTNKWLGYKETNLEAQLLFKQPTTLSSVSFSTLVDIGSYIMPPAELQVWGGNSPKSLTLLNKLIPEQPEKVGMPGYRQGFTLSFESRKLSVLKIVAKPVSKLPAWHPGKGERGWVFIDELFLE